MVQDLEQILEETPGIRAKVVPVFHPDFPGAKPLSAAGPPILLGGTLSGHPGLNVQEKGSLYSKENIHVNQGSKNAATATPAAKKQQKWPKKYH